MTIKVLNLKGLTLPSPLNVPQGTYTLNAEGTYNIANYEFIEVLIEKGDIKKVVCSSSTTWVLKKDGTLWGCGHDSSGQQGSGSTSNVLSFTQRLDNVKDFACSSDTTWAIKNDGTLWGCGDARYGQQGSNESGSGRKVSVFTQRMTDAKKVFGTWTNTCVLKNDGTLWMCGLGSSGQQSSGSTSDVKVFTQRAENVKDGKASGSAVWILKEDNTLWGCGSGGNGKQGSGSMSDVKTFTQRLENVKDFDCSESTTWAVKNDGTLWGCGYNDYGQQGNGTYGGGTDVTTFTQRMEDAKEVCCSSITTWVIKNDDTLWGCGRSDYGQQGSGTSGSNINVKTFTQRLTDVKKVYACTNATFALKKDGTLWGCGTGLTQGNGGGSVVKTFTQRLENVKDASLSISSMWVLKTDGTVWGCGSNEYGQQGSGDTTGVYTFTQRIPA